MKFVQLFWCFAAILSLVVAAPQGIVELPSKDPFYSAPEGYEKAELGTVLKIRKTPHPLRSVYFKMKVKNTWQILYRSSDTFGNATAVVTTIIEPFNSDPKKLVSYQIAEDASHPDCAPSYSIQYGASMNTIVAQAEMFLIQIALNQGWWIVTPDYEGPKASFTAGRQAGKAVLDSVRAALASTNTTGLDPDCEVVLWGYSGGSLATGWASALQPVYAPELKPRLLGATLGGFVTNITETILAVDNTLYAGLIANGINGLSNEYPQLQNIVDGYLDPKYKPIFERNGNKCMVLSIMYTAYGQIMKGVNKWFPKGYDMLYMATVKDTIYNTTLAVDKTEMPQIPLFIYHGLKDGIVPEKNSERAYKIWCDWGIESLELSVSTHTRHITEFVAGAPAAIKWIGDRFDHKAPLKGCSRSVFPTTLLYPGISSEIVAAVKGAARTIFGQDIGPLINSTLALNARDLNKHEIDLRDYDHVVEQYLHKQYEKRSMGAFGDFGSDELMEDLF